MARQPRPLIAGGVYHVYNRGVVKLPIFADTLDRIRFLRGLSEVVHRWSWTCLAYCLMGNHFHLVVATPGPDLDRGMQRLQATYAQAFNRRHGRTGHLFHARYGATVLEDEELTRYVVRYVLQNPVAAGLCRTAGDWPWSSHRATLGHVAEPPCLAAESLLRLFGGRSAYREYVDPGITRPPSPTWARGPASAPRRST
jgi:REP-associated tyrosine transposase